MPASLELSILAPAFLAGLLVIVTHVPLGQRVLARGIVFIDLAIAQVAGLGVIVAAAIGWEPHGWHAQVAAVVAALLGAALLTWTERHWPTVQEALIGVLFVAAASVEILVLANDPHGGEDLKDMLVGQILWVTSGDLIPVVAVYAGVLAVWVFGQRRLTQGGFYLLFAVTVTQSVQLVGIYLVFATLILPALAGFGCRHRTSQVLGYGTATAGYLLGIAGSAVFDLPTGPAIVCALVACSIGIALSRLRFFQGPPAKPPTRS